MFVYALFNRYPLFYLKPDPSGGDKSLPCCLKHDGKDAQKDMDTFCYLVDDKAVFNKFFRMFMSAIKEVLDPLLHAKGG